MGLQRLGIGTGEVYTPFIDDKQISLAAKTATYAAFLGQLIDYLRYDLQKDYNEKILMN